MSTMNQLRQLYETAAAKLGQAFSPAPVDLGSEGKVPLNLGTATDIAAGQPSTARNALAAASALNPVTASAAALAYLGADPGARKAAARTVGSAAQWFNPAEAGVTGPAEAIGAKLAPNFFSVLKKVVKEKFGNLIEGQQAKNTLFSVDPKTGQKIFNKGVTADEYERSGLDELLQPGQKVSKADLLKQIDANTPELKDVMLETKPDGTITGEERAALQPPKFEHLTMPGGSNYRELFVTVPQRSPNLQPYQELSADEYNKIQAGQWKDGHPHYSDIENPIVRIRMKDRLTPDGKKVLFVEEMQPPQPEEQEKMPPELLKRWREIGMKRVMKYAADNGYDQVAWTTGQKQLKRYRIGDIVDHINVAPQLPDQLRNVEIMGKSGRDFTMSVDKAGKVIYSDTDEFQGQPLSAVIGEAMAKKILTGPEKTTYGGEAIRFLEQESGLPRVYDEDLPNVTRKLGAKPGKVSVQIGGSEPGVRYSVSPIFRARTGESTHEFMVMRTQTVNGSIKTEPVGNPFSSRGEANEWIAENSNNHPIEAPGFDVAPIRDRAKKGFSIYDLPAPLAGAGAAAKLLYNYVNADKGEKR